MHICYKAEFGYIQLLGGTTGVVLQSYLLLFTMFGPEDEHAVENRKMSDVNIHHNKWPLVMGVEHVLSARLYFVGRVACIAPTSCGWIH